MIKQEEMQQLLIKNIKELIQVEQEPVNKVCGAAMSKLLTIKNAWVLIEKDEIKSFGEMNVCPKVESTTQVIDAAGKMVFPSFCDSHTHLVFAASREEEFVDRINGLSYEEIAAKGGGI